MVVSDVGHDISLQEVFYKYDLYVYHHRTAPQQTSCLHEVRGQTRVSISSDDFLGVSLSFSEQ